MSFIYRTFLGSNRVTHFSLEQWTVDDVVKWAMKFIDMEDANKLRVEKIDGATLLDMTDAAMFKECKIPYGPSMKLAKAVNELRGSAQSMVTFWFLGNPMETARVRLLWKA